MSRQRGRLPEALLTAADDRRGGATEVARQALDGLLEIAGDRALLAEAAEVLLQGQPAMAPIWHLARAARGEDPPAALAALRERLDRDAEAAAETAVAWLLGRPGPGPRPGSHRGPGSGLGPGAGLGRGSVATVSHSSLVDLVLERLPGHSAGGAATVGVVGADALGPEALLNAAGTLALADRVPTLVVATPVKLVPAEVFARLAAPGFEAVPLEALAAVALGPELISPTEAGRRAAALRD
jgi:hypothetical protein